MQRILTELTPECELTTQMYISGLEKEEIAEIRHASKIKSSGILDEAIKQRGRTIVIDSDLALELFGNRK